MALRRARGGSGRTSRLYSAAGAGMMLHCIVSAAARTSHVLRHQSRSHSIVSQVVHRSQPRCCDVGAYRASEFCAVIPSGTVRPRRRSGTQFRDVVRQVGSVTWCQLHVLCCLAVVARRLTTRSRRQCGHQFRSTRSLRSLSHLHAAARHRGLGPHPTPHTCSVSHSARQVGPVGWPGGAQDRSTRHPTGHDRARTCLMSRADMPRDCCASCWWSCGDSCAAYLSRGVRRDARTPSARQRGDCSCHSTHMCVHGPNLLARRRVRQREVDDGTEAAQQCGVNILRPVGGAHERRPRLAFEAFQSAQ